jgi:hypothetical protein
MWSPWPVVLATWAVASVILAWGRLPVRWRRVFALFTSACGIVFLALALNTEGQRESATVGAFLMGAPYVAGKASAAASLPYYLATGVLFALGFLGLTAGDRLVARLAERPLLNAVALSWGITALRFVLEKAAAPEAWTRPVGVTWLAPVVGGYLALCLRREGRPFKALLPHLVAYAFAVRGLVALLMLAASAFHLGSHYDISGLREVEIFGRRYSFEPDSGRGVLAVTAFSQLLFWPIYTVLSGLLGAGIAHLLAWAWRSDKRPAGGAAPLAAPDRS